MRNVLAYLAGGGQHWRASYGGPVERPPFHQTTPIEDRLRNLQPLEFEPVRRTAEEPLFNSLMEEHGN